jgi:hypothetical protein
MANDPLAPANPPEPTPPAAADYQAFSEVLSASARGRAFLAEHARRSRSAETRTLLAALARIETMVRDNTANGTPRIEVLALLTIIRDARPDIAASAVPVRAARLTRLLDLLERRLAALAEPLAEAEAAPATARLAAVPPPEEPELPIPSPDARQAPQLTVAAARSAAETVPEVNWLDSVPAAPVRAEETAAAEPEAVAPVADTRPRLAAAILTMLQAHASAEKTAAPVAAPEEAAPSAPADAAAVPPPGDRKPSQLPPVELAPPSDPLSAITRLTEVERIALFT